MLYHQHLHHQLHRLLQRVRSELHRQLVLVRCPTHHFPIFLHHLMFIQILPLTLIQHLTMAIRLRMDHQQRFTISTAMLLDFIRQTMNRTLTLIIIMLIITPVNFILDTFNLIRIQAVL